MIIMIYKYSNNVYYFIKSQVKYRTCYNQSTGYTKYGPPAQHAD